MPAHRSLNANLIPLAGAQADFDERRVAKRLDHAVLARRFHRARIARGRWLLRERALIPRQSIAPCSARRRGTTLHDRPVHTLGLVIDELLLERLLRARV